LNNQKLRYIPLLFCSLFLISCANEFPVATDYDEAYSFSDFRTYTIETPDDLIRTVDELQQERVEAALGEYLAARGYVESSSADADMILSYFGTSEEGTDIDTYQTYNSFYSYNTCFHCGGIVVARSPFPQTQVRTVDYTEGVLMIDFIDPASNALKWRGQTSLRLSRREADSLDVAERTEIVDSAVKAILDQFPPGYEAPE